MRVVTSAVRVVVCTAAIVAAVVALIRQPTLDADVPQHVHANPATLHADVVALTSMERCASDPSGLDEAARYIARRFAASGARVREQVFPARRSAYRNVVAEFDGANPPIVVGAHYDAFCEPWPLPGADDNASGVAGLIELARILRASPRHIAVTLVAYSTEEPPFFGSEEMGSAVHARSAGEIRGMICLEMIGCFTPRQPSPSPLLAMLYPSRGDFVVVAGRWRDVALLREVKRAMSPAIATAAFAGPGSAGIDASDQRSYWAAGKHAVMITDTAYIRNPRYHTSRDTAPTLDYAKMARVVDGVANALLSAK